jgi:hypothetical protein
MRIEEIPDKAETGLRERKRERERERVCERGRERVCVCVCVWESEVEKNNNYTYTQKKKFSVCLTISPSLPLSRSVFFSLSPSLSIPSMRECRFYDLKLPQIDKKESIVPPLTYYLLC